MSQRRIHRLLFLGALLFALHASARESTLLDSGWRFMQGDPAGLGGQATNPADANWNDANWPAISIPHCWGWEGAQAGKTNYYRGPGWYRRELVVTPEKGKRYFVKFDAAATVADVYLNGKLLGQHRGAFGAFCFEVTKQLSSGGTNLLALRVSNAVEPDVAPLSGDFPVYGGLYRHAYLLETGDINFTPTDHASPGVAWLQTSVSKKEATLDVTAQISNGLVKTQHLTLVATMLDANGKTVASTSQPIVLATNVTAPYWLRVIVPKPHLWNGRLDPYLYRAVVELHSTNAVVDSVEQQIGLRFYHVDPTNGFFLNGKPYQLHGVCKHQDRPDKGWAISEADLDEDISLIKEIGARVVRCAHYQHSDYFYSLCDKAGILVWAEIPQVDKIGRDEKFEETSQSQLRDLIRQNVNHPSIFVWSLFNELRAGNPDPHRELQDLVIVAHGEDPTRPTIAATCTDKLPEMNKIPDLLGWNIYPGWYSEWGGKDGVGKMLDGYRYTSRSGGFCVSEYGAGGNVAQHEQNPKQPKTTGQWHPEEWEGIVHETAWAAMKQRPWVWGTFVWNMFDFAVASRHEGGIPGRNTKGLVTYDRKTKKDAFYFYKANWSDEPVVYITDRRFTERTNAATDVKIYSNAKQVELFVNGKSQSTRANDGNSVFVWKNIQLSPGENQIEARSKRNGQMLRDSAAWTLLSTK
jgi:beta-galactosidase